MSYLKQVANDFLETGETKKAKTATTKQSRKEENRIGQQLEYSE